MCKGFYALILGFILFSCETDESSNLVFKKGNSLFLKAGILERKIDLAKDGATTSYLLLEGRYISNESREFSVNISKASPNEEPRGIDDPLITGVSQQDAVENNTDALAVDKKGTRFKQELKWIENEVVSTDMIGSVEAVHYSIENSLPQKITLALTYIFDKGKWPGISATVHYEIYEDYPVIRKWVEFNNSGRQWIKLDHLKVDDIELNESYTNQTLLAPNSREINSCLIAFSDTSESKGIISANEIPSKLKQIFRNGSSGYHPDFFEWVLGPSETFISEAVFMFGFSGKTYPTISAISTALDRCVEGNFKDFLNQIILKPVQKVENIAPVFCTWTNYNANINEQNMHEAAKIASQMGFKCFQLDAGWSDTGLDGGWAVTKPKPNLDRFPDLKGLSQHILANNMKTGLWYSVFLDEQEVDKTGKEPVLYSLPLIKRAGGLGLSFCYDKSRKHYVNDLVYLHENYEADYFKQDLSNVCYGDLAQEHESRTIKESYLRGLRGLLTTQDDIHERAPEVWLQLSHEIYWETPGPEADIAVLQHADSYHSAPNEYWGAGNRKELVNSGWNYDVKEVQDNLIQGAFRARNLWYAHRGLPLERIEVFGAVTTNYRGSLSSEVLDRQICSWLMGAPLSFSGDLTSLTDENIKQYRSRFTMLDQMQKQYGIYNFFQYSGVPQPTDSDWHWWGKLNSDGYGVVVVMRGNSGENDRKINIPWVKTDRAYRVKGLPSGIEFGIFEGIQLQEGLLSLKLNHYGQEIIVLSAV
ncbi:MAG: alpha-galactosidase [Draconibacterium sp.]